KIGLAPGAHAGAEGDGARASVGGETAVAEPLHVGAAAAEVAREVEADFEHAAVELEVGSVDAIGGAHAQRAFGDAGGAGVAVVGVEEERARAGLVDAAGAAEHTGEPTIDGGRAVGDADFANLGAERDGVGEGEHAVGVIGGEQQGVAGRNEVPLVPGELAVGGAGGVGEADGAVAAEGREAAVSGPKDLLLAGAETAGEGNVGGEFEHTAGQLDRAEVAARVVGVVAAGQAVGGDAQRAVFDDGVAGVGVGPGESDDAGADLGERTGTARLVDDAREGQHAVSGADGGVGGEGDRTGKGVVATVVVKSAGIAAGAELDAATGDRDDLLRGVVDVAAKGERTADVDGGAVNG